MKDAPRDVVRRFEAAGADPEQLADSIRRLAEVLKGPGPNAERLERALSDLARLPPTRASADLIERFIAALDTAATWLHARTPPPAADVAALYDETTTVLRDLFGPMSGRLAAMDDLVGHPQPGPQQVALLKQRLGDERHLVYLFESVQGPGWFRALRGDPLHGRTARPWRPHPDLAGQRSRRRGVRARPVLPGRRRHARPQPRPRELLGGGPARYVLGARYATDVLVARPDVPSDGKHSHLCFSGQGGRPELITTARRAAWASLAFAPRVQAVGEPEHRTPRARGWSQARRCAGHGGSRPASVAGGHHRERRRVHDRAFRRDYVRDAAGGHRDADQRHLGGPDEHSCGSSCPGCLRDWSNTPYHPLLDWRLAADLLDVLLHGAPRLERWATVRTSAVQKVCKDFAWSTWKRAPTGRFSTPTAP